MISALTETRVPQGSRWKRAVQAAACARASCRSRFHSRGVSSKTSRARMRRDALEYIAQIDERIDLQVLTRLHQRTQDGGSARRAFAPREQSIENFGDPGILPEA